MKTVLSFLLALTAILLLGTVTSAAGPHNIFDDDWAPPKPSETPRPTPLQPAPVKPPPVATDPTPPTPRVTPLAVPAKPQQASVRKIMKEVYADQIADSSSPARRKLAETLLSQAAKSTGTPVDQFVLLSAAIDAAIDAADLPLAFSAADRMCERFEVDALALKAETTTKINPRAATPDSAIANVEAGLELATQLATVDDYVAAVRVCMAVQTLSAGNAELRASVQQKQREVSLAREVHDRIARDLKKLQSLPNDPSANFAVGHYYCFVKGDWERGLPMLRKGSDAALKSLATQELAGVSATDAVLRLADGWWETAAKQNDAPTRAGIMSHAASLYSQAVKQVDGLRRVQIEKRIAEAEKFAASLGGSVESKAATMIVYGDKTPQPAGEVKKGQKIKITAKGAWTSNINDFGGKPCFGPDGVRVDGMPGHNDLCILEAYIGTTVIKIGKEKTIEIPEDGILRFGMHDSNGEAGIHDNAGQMSLTITIASKSSGAAALGIGDGPKTHPGNVITMVVYANKLPQAVGEVKKGQRLRVTAKGAWTPNFDDTKHVLIYGPDGYRVDGSPGHNGMAELNAYLGKTAIPIGYEKVIVIPEDGILRFGIADSEAESAIKDNDGQMSLTIMPAR